MEMPCDFQLKKKSSETVYLKFRGLLEEKPIFPQNKYHSNEENRNLLKNFQKWIEDCGCETSKVHILFLVHI